MSGRAHGWRNVISCSAFLRYVASGDQTPILRTGYWASYNIPFYEYVYDISGFPDLVQKCGADCSYQLCARAKIFRRDEAKVCQI